MGYNNVMEEIKRKTIEIYQKDNGDCPFIL
jgi:hypothetical protein